MKTISEVTADVSDQLPNAHSAKVLLCYLLKKLERPVTPDQLYEIAVTSGIVNYFYYAGAVDELVKNETILLEEQDGVLVYVLAPKGIYTIDELKQYAPKSFRDRLFAEALRYFARLRREREVKISYTEAGNGYYIECRILDIGEDLLQLKLFAPDLEQAELIGEKIMANPTDFYGKIIGFALENKEENPIIE